MEAGDPADSPKDARLEDQRALRVPASLDNPNPEVRQRLQKPSSPATAGEVVQRQVAFILATINVQFSLHGGTYGAIYLDMKAVINHNGLSKNNPIFEHSQSVVGEGIRGGGVCFGEEGG